MNTWKQDRLLTPTYQHQPRSHTILPHDLTMSGLHFLRLSNQDNPQPRLQDGTPMPSGVPTTPSLVPLGQSQQQAGLTSRRRIPTLHSRHSRTTGKKGIRPDTPFAQLPQVTTTTTSNRGALGPTVSMTTLNTHHRPQTTSPASNPPDHAAAPLNFLQPLTSRSRHLSMSRALQLQTFPLASYPPTQFPT